MPIPKTFYEDAEIFISNNTKTTDEANTKTNAATILNNILDKRVQKILIYIAYNKTLPQPISNLEQEFCDKVLEVLKANKLKGINIKTQNKILLKSLNDMPEVILPSGNKAGPFKKGEVIEISNQDKDISFLLDNAICERLQSV